MNARCTAREPRVGTFCQLSADHAEDHRFSTPHATPTACLSCRGSGGSYNPSTHETDKCRSCGGSGKASPVPSSVPEPITNDAKTAVIASSAFYPAIEELLANPRQLAALGAYQAAIRKVFAADRQCDLQREAAAAALAALDLALVEG